MKAFISYSHHDTQMLEKLHTHLTQLKREGILTLWTDEEIMPGGDLNLNISNELESSQLFIALLSPDYIASGYCYNNEFKSAMSFHDKGIITIIPIIVEPCDWLSTPFKSFKALPKDGKPISEFENINTAFLDITQSIRRLLDIPASLEQTGGIPQGKPIFSLVSKNYRVKKDFDSIQKLEFVETAFKDIKDTLKRYLDELILIDENIKYRILKTDENDLEYILVNRNKIGIESNLLITIKSESSPLNYLRGNDKEISCVIEHNNRKSEKSFVLSHDDYHMYWVVNNPYYSKDTNELSSRNIVEVIWEEWLESVGIMNLNG